MHAIIYFLNKNICYKNSQDFMLDRVLVVY